MRFTYGVLIAVVLGACGSKSGGGDVDAGPGDDQADASFPDADLGPDADLCTGGTLCGTPLSCCPAGNECVLDQCVTTCATGVYCGANLATCCGANQVCSDDACVDPGSACTDSYDCDPGNFCEPTLHQCLPQPDPLTCKIQPVFDDLQVTLEHSYATRNIISIPVVANLDGAGAPEIVVNTTSDTDFTDGGIVVLDGATFTVKLGPIPDNRANATNPTYASQGRSTIAVGDVDGDGKPDIIYAAKTSAISGPGNAGVNGLGSGGSIIVAIKGDGTFLWKSHLPATPTLGYSLDVQNGAPTLAQFDDDKGAEIAVGGVLLDNDGTVIWDGGATQGTGSRLGSPSGYIGGIAAIADLDNDTHPEIITGLQAWKVNWNKTTPTATTVTQYWKVPTTVTTTDGWPGIANFTWDLATTMDTTPEVVLVSNGKVIVVNGQTGALWCAKATCTTAADYVQPIAIPGGGRGGNPTVADFDGDGRPEIGVAGGGSYSVYDIYRPGEDVTGVTPAPTAGQLFVRWTKTTQDLSSNVTGSSVFDFQGDGSSEVVYEDECFVRVYSGTDGREQLKLPNLTGTIHEYPLVVDADGDGNSEILIVANEMGVNPNACPTPLPANTTHKGLFMYGDTNDKWVPTRKVWTQHAYHVTNSTNAGNVPDFPEDNNWMDPKLNDYRKNAQGEGVFNAPNLTVELAVGLDNCSMNKLTLRARVTNVGALGVVPGTAVEFRLNDATGTVLGAGTITTPLLPGGSGVVKLDVDASVGMNFWAGVDGAPAVGVVAECNENDNQDTAIGAHCPVIF